MTSRERIKNLLNRQKVDRIPFGLGGCETEGMHVLTYNRLKKILGINDNVTRMYTFMANAVFEISVLEALDADIIILGSGMCPVPLWGKESRSSWKDQELWGSQFQVPAKWTFRKEADGTIWWDDWHMKCPPNSYYFDWIPLSNSYDSFMAKVERPTPDDYNPPTDIPDEKLRVLEDSAKWLYENTDFSIACGELLTDLQLKPGGYIDWCMRMIEEPEVIHEFLDKACDASISQMKLLNQAVGKYCDFICMADDIGDNNGVTIGPDLWREIYKPHYKKLFAEFHTISNMKINFHSCGSIFDIIDDLIECGVDILNPVQISAKNMEPERLKANFGDRIIFFGGGFDASLIPPETPDEIVYETVKKNISIFAEGGGYIFSGVHNLPWNMPESHIKAMIAAYRDSNEKK